MDWEVVYNSETNYRAEIVKGVLEEHQINAIIINKKDSNYHFGHFDDHRPHWILYAALCQTPGLYELVDRTANLDVSPVGHTGNDAGVHYHVQRRARSGLSLRQEMLLF